MVRSLEQTVTSAGVRRYVTGDPPRYVHWPLSLHVRQLMVKDFDLQPAGDLWLVLDLEGRVQAGELDESTEEYMVVAAASLAARALRHSRQVGLLGFGDRRLFVPPGRGEHQFWRIMRELATIRAQGAWSIAQVLDTERTFLQRGASLAILASSASSSLPEGLAAVRRLGIGTNALLFDAASFGGSGDTRALSDILVDLDVPHSVISRDHEFLPLSRRERLRRRGWKSSERWGLVSAPDRF